MERRLKAIERLKVDSAERIEQDSVFRYEFTLMYGRYDQGLRELDNGRNLCLQAISIGDVIFVGFPGEIFTDISQIVKQAFLWQTVITLGQVNGDAGYIATRDDIEEKRYGGYACYDFVFNKLSLAPGIGESIARRAVYMVDEMLWPSGE